MSKQKKENEIESLNIDDLDIEELEHRIELASGSILSLEPCKTFDCGSLTCETDCYGFDKPKATISR